METATGPGVECAPVTVFWPMKSCRQMSPGDRSENKKKKLFLLYSDNNHFLNIKVKLIRQASRWIIIRPEYKQEELFIIFRTEVATSLQLDRKLRPCYIILPVVPDSICYSIQFVLPKHYLRFQASHTLS